MDTSKVELCVCFFCSHAGWHQSGDGFECQDCGVDNPSVEKAVADDELYKLALLANITIGSF